MSYPVSLSVCLQPVCLSACSAFTSPLPVVLQSFMKIAGARCAGTERKSAGGRGRKVGGGSCDKMLSHYPSFIIPSSCIPPSSSSLILSSLKLHFLSFSIFLSNCLSLSLSVLFPFSWLQFHSCSLPLFFLSLLFLFFSPSFFFFF